MIEETTEGADHAPDQAAREAAVEPTEQSPTERAATAQPTEVAGVAVSEVLDRTRVRRAPRFGAFLFVGLVLAFLVSFGLSYVRDWILPEQVQGRALDSWGLFLLLFIFLALFFALGSYGVAVLVDQASVRRLVRDRPGEPTSPHQPRDLPRRGKRRARGRDAAGARTEREPGA